jgi:hypothetical protein
MEELLYYKPLRPLYTSSLDEIFYKLICLTSLHSVLASLEWFLAVSLIAYLRF